MGKFKYEIIYGSDQYILFFERNNHRIWHLYSDGTYDFFYNISAMEIVDFT